MLPFRDQELGLPAEPSLRRVGMPGNEETATLRWRLTLNASGLMPLGLVVSELVGSPPASRLWSLV